MEFSEKLFLYQKIFTNGEMCLPIGEIYQVAELSIVAGGVISPHIQRCDEITYVISGKAKICSDSTIEEVTAGKIHYTKKGCEHTIIADNSGKLHYMCVGFIPNIENEVYSDFIKNTKDMGGFVVDDNGDVRKILELAMDEIYIMDTNSPAMMNMYLSQILIFFNRILIGGKEKEKKKTTFAMQSEDMFQNEIDGFIDCIESGEKLASHIDTNIITAKMMDAIYLSANEHREITL